MAFNLSAKSAFIVALLAFSASATPVEPISPCAAVTCSTNTFCNVINGKPVCLPISRQQKCGRAVCAPGHVCCNSSCGICTKPGGVCTQQICPDIELQPVEPAPTVDKREDIVKIEEPELPAVKPTKCGPTLCAPGYECCNESCGICTKPGQGCHKMLCVVNPPKTPTQPCGKTICAEGLVCCNSSCGICAPADGACTQQYCLPVE